MLWACYMYVCTCFYQAYCENGKHPDSEVSRYTTLLRPQLTFPQFWYSVIKINIQCLFISVLYVYMFSTVYTYTIFDSICTYVQYMQFYVQGSCNCTTPEEFMEYTSLWSASSTRCQYPQVILCEYTILSKILWY